MSSNSQAVDAALPPQATPRTYTVAQLAEILQVEARTVLGNTKSGNWPHIQIGPKTVRFTDTHLNAILTGTEAAPAPQRPANRRTRRPR